MIDILYCNHCEQNQTIKITEKTFSNGTKHLSSSCDYCGTFIKFIMQDIPPEEFYMPFGKYRGKKMKEIPRDYLEWGIKNLKGSVAERMKLILNK